MRDIREKERETLDGQRRFPRTTAGVRECWNVTERRGNKGDQRKRLNQCPKCVRSSHKTPIQNNSTLITSRHVFSVEDTADLYLKARTHRDEFRARYSPTFNAS